MLCAHQLQLTIADFVTVASRIDGLNTGGEVLEVKP